MNNLNLIILCGGNSSEREVSISTGVAIYDSLKKNSHVELLDYRGKINDYLPQLKKTDLVILALHGGEGENGEIQSFFENNGIKYTGSNSVSSKLAMDKNQTKIIARSNSIPTPKWLMYNPKIDLKEQYFEIINLGLPLVVKPSDEGSTMGLSIIQNEIEIKTALDFALEYSNKVMFEEFIPGRELTVGILGNNFLPIVEIIPSHELYDFECKYTEGMSHYVCPAEIEEEIRLKIQEDALKIHRKIGCQHYSRIDFRLNTKNEYFMLEINTLPGMTSTSLLPKAAKAMGISFDGLLNKIIELAKNDNFLQHTS